MRNPKRTTIWHYFIKALPLTLIAMAIAVVGVLAATGTLDSPADPGSTSSFSLEDVYQRLTNGAAGSQRAFTEPAVAPGTGTMHTINDIMAAAPELDDEDGATASDVLAGSTYWGLTNGEWGVQTGTMPEGSDVVGEEGSLIIDIPDACYSGKTATAVDDNLNPLNIKLGVTILGVEGKYRPGWSVYDQINENYHMFGLDMVSATEGWAGGAPVRTDAIFYYFDGINWTQHSIYIAYGRVTAIDMISAEDGWAATQAGVIFHYTGATDTWNAVSSFASTRFVDLEMVSADEGWAVSEEGVIYHYRGDQDEWVKYQELNIDATDLEMVSADDGWIMDYLYGYMYRYNNVTGNWEFIQDLPMNATSMDMVSATDGWLVGNGGYINRFDSDSGNWNLHERVEGNPNFTVIKMVSSTEGWAIDTSGQVYHYDGGTNTWSPYGEPLGMGIYELFVVNESDVWGVGNLGTFVHYMD